MTEVASPVDPRGLHVLSVRHYEGTSPVPVVEPENVATTKEEEWVTKKKVEVTTKRQIETRVKRQVVVEDGKIVEDSGPIVTTNTTEDTEKQESRQTEHRNVGDDQPEGEQWALTTGPGVVKEVKEHTERSRQEKQELLETEDVRHLGDISDDGYLSVVRSGEALSSLHHLQEVSPTSGQGRIVRQSSKSKKTVDTEDKHHLSEVDSDGRIVTQTKKTTEHEEVRDEEEPDAGSESGVEESQKESKQHYKKTKDQELVEYRSGGVKVGQEMRYNAETMEGAREGDPVDWDSLSQRARRMRRTKILKNVEEPVGGVGAVPVPVDRKDALTKKPLDLDVEEETRKVETSKWLEHHFGSESRSSKDSMDEDEDTPTGKSTSFINVTMKSTKQRTTSPSFRTLAKVSPMEAPKSYFQGVTEWRATEREATPSRTFSKSPSPPYTNGQSLYKTYHTRSTHHLNGKPANSPPPKRSPPSRQRSAFSRSFEDSAKKYTGSTLAQSRSCEERAEDYTRFNGGAPKYAVTPPAQNRSYDEKAEDYARFNGGAPKYTGTPPAQSRSYEESSEHTRLNGSSRKYTGSPPTLTNSRSYEDQVDHARFNGNSLKHTPPTLAESRSFDETAEHARHNGSTRKYTGSPATLAEKRAYEMSRLHESRAHATSPPEKFSSSYNSSRYFSERTSSSPYDRPRRTSQDSASAGSSPFAKTNAKLSSEDEAPTPRRARVNGHAEREEESEDQRASRRSMEPAPDYPAETRGTPSPPQIRASPPPEALSAKKKLYQRTRFAADIPPAKNKPKDSTSEKRSLGESFRRLVTKLRSSSADRKKKGALEGGGGPVEGEGPPPVAPPRSRHADRGTQTREKAGEMAADRERGSPITKFYLGEDPFGGSSIYGREREYQGVTTYGKRRSRNDRTTVPNSSTLGRFSKSTGRLINDRSSPLQLSTTNHQVIDYSDRGGIQTLPRKLHDEHRVKNQVYMTRSNTERVSSSPHSHWENNRYNNRLNGNNSASMINVSIVNHVTPPTSLLANGGPAKPARTYRSSLLRSKSFNVHAGDPDQEFHSIYKSNPQLHRLDESPPPLKSPGIVTSINRSTKDISEAVNDESRPYAKGANGFTNSRVSSHETKKKIFMKGLMDRAPELFKTLHGHEVEGNRKNSPEPRLYTSTPLRNGRILEHSTSFRSSPADRVHSPVSGSSTYTTSITHSPSFRNTGETTNRSVVRRGSNDDYSETVHITSKSDDPIRPSVTNTVQSFSKKTQPTKGGKATETIESSETKTVTKSRYRGGTDDGKYSDGGNKYATRNGGVVIEVRNSRK